jgi:CHAD domain-containing protein
VNDAAHPRSRSHTIDHVARNPIELRSDGVLDLEGLGEALESRFFTSTYHDTVDRRLLRSGITLRRRLEGGVNLWQLQLPLGDASHRAEAHGPPAAPPPEIAGALAGLLRGRDLTALATLQTRRDAIRVESNGSAADVTVDTVAVLDGHKTSDTFTEIEIELVHGDPRTMRSLEKDVRKLGAERSEGAPMVVRMLGVATDEAPASDAERLRAFIAHRTDELLAADAALRLELGDEAVHKLRVACRRLRSALRTARPLVARDWADELRAELAWFAGELGPLRDLDVGIAQVREDAERLGDDRRVAGKLITQLTRERKAAEKRARAALSTERYFALLDRLERDTGKMPILESDVRLDDLARKELKRLRKTVRTLDDASGDERVHRARILGKRTRYAAELVGDEDLANAAKRFQDVVGAHQDALVLADLVRAAADRAGDPRAALAGGRIIERQLARRDEARNRLPKAWRRLERAARR